MSAWRQIYLGSIASLSREISAAMGYAMEAGDFGAPLHCLHAPSSPFRRSPPLEMTLERGNTGANTSFVIPVMLHVSMETKVSGLYGISES